MWEKRERCLKYVELKKKVRRKERVGEEVMR